MANCVWTFLLIFITLDGGIFVTGSQCSSQNRTDNMTACLDTVEDMLFDTSLFWFGDEYASKCGGGGFSMDLSCMFYNPSETTLATRSFSNAAAAQNVDRFLELHFQSGGKNYTACGNDFFTNETWSMDTDPTSDTIVYPWYVRHFPVSVNWNFTEGEYFTLMVYDISYYVSHGIYTNIQGDDMTTADVIKEYHGPRVASNMLIPYTFMLFKQNGRVTVSQEWIQKVNYQNWGRTWTIDDFIAAVNLQEMVAINWIVATGDEWAAQYMLDTRVTVSCPDFATKVLHETPRPFIPNNTALTVWVDVTFMRSPTSYSVCCKNYFYRAGNLTLNPIGNPVYKSWDLSTDTPFTVSLLKVGLYDYAMNFTGDMYTLVTIDPDVPFSTVATQERPLLHGLVTNIMDGDVDTGDVGRSYRGPAPPDFRAHTYYMLLYKQQSSLNATEMLKYAGNSCSAALDGRCLFDINKLVSENGLTLVGATWFRVETDDYVLRRQIEAAGGNETEVCKDEPGYIDSTCPVDSSVSLAPSLLCVVYFIFTFTIKFI